jgi:hypothetical protein
MPVSNIVADSPARVIVRELAEKIMKIAKETA